MAMSEDGRSERIEQLIGALRDDNEALRDHAIASLSQLGEEAVEPLIGLMADEDVLIREAATIAVVRMGLDGHRWGLPVGSAAARRSVRDRVDELLASVGATDFADAPVALLSGGELQRVRVAAALASDPRVLLCDEPLAALDLRHQQDVAALLDRRRRERGTAVLFVTHDINAVLDYVDQVLYLAEGRFRLGTPEQVLTSASLTER